MHKKPIKLNDLIYIVSLIYNYNLDLLDTVHLGFELLSPSTFVCNHNSIIYIDLRTRIKSLSELCHLLLNISNRDCFVKRYIYNI